MKILGLLLIVGALLAGGILLSDSIPRYYANQRRVERARAEASEETARVKAIGARPYSGTNGLQYAIQSAESAVKGIRSAEDSVARARDESLLASCAALALIALGAFLFVRARRREAPATRASSTTP
jgi:hypothetical protein